MRNPRDSGNPAFLPRQTRSARPFSDALAFALAGACVSLAAGCVRSHGFTSPGSPLLAPRIHAVLPPQSPAQGRDAAAAPLFVFPEYSRRDRDLGVRR